MMGFRARKIVGMICAAMLIYGTAWAAEPVAANVTEHEVGTANVQTAAVTNGEQKAHEEELIPMVNDGTKIMVNLASRGIYLYEKGIKTKIYPIACGRVEYRSPVGYYKVYEKAVNPTWIDPSNREVEVASGPDNPLGYRWIGFNGYYGIHGTNNPASIGTYASKGCIRMREEDVEDLYERVDVGTPVEVYYNRCVMEKSPDGTVVYYIYPDAYDCQPITVEQINEWLHGYGVDCFESNEAIQTNIDDADGEPNYVAKPFNLLVNGIDLQRKAVLKDGIYYLPIYQLSEVLNIPVHSDLDAGMVRTSHGFATVYLFKDILYVNADEVEGLFNISGGKFSNNSMVYKSNPVKAVEPVREPETVKEPVKEIVAQQNTLVQAEAVKQPEKVVEAEKAKEPEKVTEAEKVELPEKVETAEKVIEPEKVKEAENPKASEEAKAPETVKEAEEAKAPETVKEAEPVKDNEPAKPAENKKKKIKQPTTTVNTTPWYARRVTAVIK
ncbi:Protein erfK/srfK precursor [Anaerovibrio sp. JC8]|uniref:L,D-transpeptidase n=1 Tax=Anaerovibrio sp. JC8 TaxID=1240085 RepID=UPI000A0A8250|nr:L,D-transpeptidase [Anaerovibrio sp. JC8]ORT99776.1 Protein erfK/srfK precursor [Anaerovibrio sp. JC8]